jgi:hypothetical protein
VTPAPRLRILGAVAVAVAALLSACGGSSAGRSAAGASPSPSNQASFTTAAPTARPSGSLPPEAPAKQGGKYYAVFLAVAGSVQDPALETAQAKAKQIGYAGGVGDINCTPGAREALNLTPSGDYTAYSIFFATAQQAQDFVNAYPGRVRGTAYITAGCLD